jgi:hypothetical protein
LTLNSYSLKRNNISTGAYSKAKADNILAVAPQTGWIMFDVNPVSAGYDYFTLLTNSTNLNVPSLFSGETYLRIQKFGSVLKIIVRYSSGNTFPTTIQATTSSASSKIRVNINLTTIEVYADGNLKATIPRPSGVINLKANSNKYQNGFTNILTSFGCMLPQSVSTLSYTELKRDVESGYAIAAQGKVKFTFDEEYKIQTNKYLPYKLYNDDHVLISSCTIDGVTTGGGLVAKLPYNFDDNRYIMNLALSPSLIPSKYYLLEVTTSTGDKRYLRILYNN